MLFTGLNQADVVFSRTAGDDLVATLASGETLTIRDQFRGLLDGGVNGVGQLVFADGGTVDRAELVEMFPISGTAADDILTGSLGDDALLGSLGADRIDGSWGNDVTIWRKGDGNDILLDTGVEASEIDILKFADVASADVSFVRGGYFHNNLDIVVAETGERVSISNHFSNGVGIGSGIEAIVFADGVRVDLADITNALYVGSENSDYIHAGDQDDLLIGGEGDDDLFGGAGADRYVSRSR